MRVGDESRPVLTCAALFFREDPPALEVVATDSYRLGVAQIPLEAGFRVSDGPCWSRRARSGSWPSSSREPKVRPGSGSGGIGRESRSRASRSASRCRVDGSNRRGRVPELEAGRAEPGGGSFEFDPEELGSALRAATSVRSATGAPVRLTLDRTCSLALKDPDLGEMREALTEAKFSPNGAGAMGSPSTPTTSPMPSASAVLSEVGCGCATASSRRCSRSGTALRADADQAA